MNKIIILGSSGQLGNAFYKQKHLFNKFELFFLNRNNFDFTNTIKLKNFFKNLDFNIVINLSAYTDVENSEKNKKEAKLMNEILPFELSKIILEKNAILIHISTDYVFDGTKNAPYEEYDKKNPLNFYGLSKSLGENMIVKTNPKGLIIRTSWIYSEFRNNFVKKIINKSKSSVKLSVVNDQFSSPTNAYDIIMIIKYFLNSFLINELDGTDIYHFSNREVCSRFDFAKKIMQINNFNVELNPISSDKFESNVNRPKYSFLNTKKMEDNLNIKIKSWKESLDIFFHKNKYKF